MALLLREKNTTTVLTFKKYRSNWTEPRHVAEVARCLAEVKGVSVEEVAAVTTRNFHRMLRWPTD